MATYIPDATVVTEPTDDRKASTMGLEFRTLKTYVRDVILAGISANTGAIAAKVSKAGDNMTGNLGIATAGTTAVTLTRVTRATDQVQVSLIGGAGGKNWHMYQIANNDDFLISETVALGNALRIYASNGVVQAPFGYAAPNYIIGGSGAQLATDAGTVGFPSANGPYTQWFGNSYAAAPSLAGAVLWGRHGLGTTMTLNSAGALSVLGAVSAGGGFLGNASSASTAPWTGISGRPTALSQFTNDLGLGSGTLTSFQGRGTPAVTLLLADVTGVLGFTPYSNANPAGYTTLGAVAGAGYQTSSGSVNFATSAGAAAVATSVAGGGTVSTTTVACSSVTASGRIEGNGGAGNGLGKITVSPSGPSGGSQGDIWFQY